MINKKLFEEVIGYGVKDLSITIDYPDNVVWSLANYTGISPYCKAINLHHLAHMCKEWALERHNYRLGSFYNGLCDISHNYTEHKSFIADTEPEAIFTACEWILKESK